MQLIDPAQQGHCPDQGACKLLQVHKTAQVAREAIRDGMSVVIGLQSTGEANTNATREESGDVLDDFVSAPKVIMQQFLEKQFPRETRECSGAELRKLMFQVGPSFVDGRLSKHTARRDAYCYEIAGIMSVGSSLPNCWAGLHV